MVNNQHSRTELVQRTVCRRVYESYSRLPSVRVLKLIKRRGRAVFIATVKEGNVEEKGTTVLRYLSGGTAKSSSTHRHRTGCAGKGGSTAVFTALRATAPPQARLRGEGGRGFSTNGRSPCEVSATS